MGTPVWKFGIMIKMVSALFNKNPIKSCPVEIVIPMLVILMWMTIRLSLDKIRHKKCVWPFFGIILPPMIHRYPNTADRILFFQHARPIILPSWSIKMRNVSLGPMMESVPIDLKEQRIPLATLRVCQQQMMHPLLRLAGENDF